MPNKICPFCKKDVSVDDATCPHCKRILFEKIGGPIYTPPPRQETKQASQPNNFGKSRKEKITKFFSKFAFWKNRPVYHKSGNIYSLQYNKADKFKKIGLVIAAVAFLFGFYLRNNNLSFSVPSGNSSAPSNNTTQNTGLIKEDKSRYYLQTFKSIGDDLAQNVKGVAKFTGTSRDNQGRLVNNYLYENKNLNIQLFNQKWNVINSEYKNLKQDIFNNKLPNQSKLNEVLNYYKSVYFFTANELWFRAYDNGNSIEVQKITNEIISDIKDDYLNNYLKNTSELPAANLLVDKIKEVSQNIETETELNQLKNKIDSCERYDNCGNYNYLIDRYNNLIPQYNAGISASKDLFSKFVNLVDVYLIFPGQDTLEQTTTNQ